MPEVSYSARERLTNERSYAANNDNNFWIQLDAICEVHATLAANAIHSREQKVDVENRILV